MREKTRIILAGQTPDDADVAFVNKLPNSMPELLEYMGKDRSLEASKRRIATGIRAMADESKTIGRGTGRSSRKSRVARAGVDEPQDDEASDEDMDAEEIDEGED